MTRAVDHGRRTGNSPGSHPSPSATQVSGESGIRGAAEPRTATQPKRVLSGALSDTWETGDPILLADAFNAKLGVPNAHEYVRDPSAPVRAPAYLELLIANVNASIESVFAPWFDGTLDPPLTYKELYTEQREFVIRGGYGGYQNDHTALNEAADDRLLIMDDPQSDQMGAAFTIQLPQVPRVDLLSKFRVGAGKVVLVEGIPPREGRLPDNILRQFSDGSYLINHSTPASCHHGLYIEQLSKLMDRLRASVGAGDVGQTIDLLATYYHTAINAHLAPRVNNSVIMGQVNHLLGRLGLRGIPHESLDFEAFVLDSGEFKPNFREAVLRQNPDISGDIVERWRAEPPYERPGLGAIHRMYQKSQPSEARLQAPAPVLGRDFVLKPDTFGSSRPEASERFVDEALSRLPSHGVLTGEHLKELFRQAIDEGLAIAVNGQALVCKDVFAILVSRLDARVDGPGLDAEAARMLEFMRDAGWNSALKV